MGLVPGLMAAALFASPALVHDDVILRGEPFGAPADLSRGASGALAQAVYRARVDAVVAVNAPDGQGSGTVIRADGWVLTCAHVLGDTEDVQVVFQGGIAREGRVVVSDPVIDLALVKVETEKPLPWIALADLATLSVGDPVVSIGHPKGFGWTVNQGIVSNLFVFRDGRHDPGVVQSQVPLNPGNSGGPLLDKAGRLVGVIAQGDPTAQSLNWSISARAVKEFLVRHSYALPDAEIVVTAQPAGAEILLDGTKIGVAPRAVARAGAGTHVVEVRKPGMGSVFAPMLVLQRTKADLDVRLTEAGTLAVSADVTGVAVYVDGVLRGEAPISIDIASGPHTVTGVKPGTADSRARTSVLGGAEVEVRLSHPSNSAFLTVASDPAGAEVIVDGESFGETPVNARPVPPGQHVIDVRVGESARRVVVDLFPEVHRRVEFDLQPPRTAMAVPSAARPEPATAAPAATRVRSPRTSAYWRRALAVTVAGAAISAGSAAVLVTEDDRQTRGLAAAGVVGGAAAFSSGPVLFFWQTAPRGMRAEGDPEDDAGRTVGAGVRFEF